MDNTSANFFVQISREDSYLVFFNLNKSNIYIRASREITQQSLKRGLVLELALWMTKLNSSLKASFQQPSETDAASKITSFLWHQIVHPAPMITSLKILDPNYLF
jgi:hypothetical protein